VLDLVPLKEECQDLNEMKDHCYTRHNLITEEKSFSTSQTEKSFSEKRAQINGTMGNFICHLCELRFNKPGQLEAHMKVHTERKFYPCQECGFIFNQQGNLKSHMRVHTGETPYTCHWCRKTFNRKGNLKVHMRIHTGETPYTCQQCGKSYVQKKNLVYHMRVHGGEKTLTCRSVERVSLKTETLKST